MSLLYQQVGSLLVTFNLVWPVCQDGFTRNHRTEELEKTLGAIQSNPYTEGILTVTSLTVFTPLAPLKDSGLFGVLPPPPAHNRARIPASSNSIPHAFIKRPLGLGARRGAPSPGPGRCPRGVYYLVAPPRPAHPSGPREPRLRFLPLLHPPPPSESRKLSFRNSPPPDRECGLREGSRAEQDRGPPKRPVWGCLSSGRLSFAHSPSAALRAGTPDCASRPPATPSLRPGGALGGSQSPPSPAPEWGPAPAPAPAAAAAAAPLVSALRAPSPPAALSLLRPRLPGYLLRADCPTRAEGLTPWTAGGESAGPLQVKWFGIKERSPGTPRSSGQQQQQQRQGCGWEAAPVPRAGARGVGAGGARAGVRVRSVCSSNPESARGRAEEEEQQREEEVAAAASVRQLR
ncbi:uncharacterized protein LOC110209022 [Phascolarctos cinereus]|uniref:Atherin-like n=1 Tax=Phascolarctos cinereus TaxID=38626 RepID=A0A6P5KDN2_PHACI|nr:atherin-like [Phascolarctos cinereus]